MTSETVELVFTEEMERDIKERLGFEMSDWLGDWWLPGGNPVLSWAEMIEWSLRILNAEATRVHYPDAYLDAQPVYAVSRAVDLPVSSVRGAKRVNAYRGGYHDFSGAMGLDFLRNPVRAQSILNDPPERNSGDGFRLSGKDSSCEVEGSWWDWICFAHNVLASDNTRLACPELHRPELKNDNY